KYRNGVFEALGAIRLVFGLPGVPSLQPFVFRYGGETPWPERIDLLATREFVLPAARYVLENPSPEELRELAAAMPNARRTAYVNVSAQTRVLSRSTPSTYLVSDEPIGTNKVIGRAEYERVAALQDAYIAEHDMLLIEGFIGSDPATRTPARL